MTDKAISGTDSRKNDRLLPCPFCGGEAEVLYHQDETYSVECTCVDCDVNPRASGYLRSRDAAIDAWNTRAERTCHALPGFTDDHTDCSACGYFLPPFYDMSSYCPNCGAKVVS